MVRGILLYIFFVLQEVKIYSRVFEKMNNKLGQLGMKMKIYNKILEMLQLF